MRSVRLTSLRRGCGGPLKRFARRRKGEATVAGVVALASMLAAAGCHPRPGVSVPAAQPARQNRPPSVRLQCEPCTIAVGKTLTVSATAQDPDGDQVSFAWTAPGGRLARPSERQTEWTAPMQEGPVPVTITVNDGKGGTATDAITIQVTKA
jgi:hypothetical protein